MKTNEITTIEPVTDEMYETIVKPYIHKLIHEQESLTAKFMNEYGLRPSDICIVERETENGRVFYPDLKSKYPMAPEPKTEQE